MLAEFNNAARRGQASQAGLRQLFPERAKAGVVNQGSWGGAGAGWDLMLRGGLLGGGSI